MNTNRWEETAQKSLDARERRHIDRGGVRSARTVRLTAAAVVVGAIGAVAFLTAGAVGDDTPLWTVVGAAASGLALVAGRVTITSDRRARALRADSDLLDERELTLQLTARADAYKWATTIVMLLSVLAQIVQPLTRPDRDPDRTPEFLMPMALYALIVFGWGVMPALPQMLHLLRSPQPEPAADLDDVPAA